MTTDLDFLVLRSLEPQLILLFVSVILVFLDELEILVVHPDLIHLDGPNPLDLLESSVPFCHVKDLVKLGLDLRA